MGGVRISSALAMFYPFEVGGMDKGRSQDIICVDDISCKWSDPSEVGEMVLRGCFEWAGPT